MNDLSAVETDLTKAIRQLGVHDHLCLIYKTREEQFAAVLPFVKVGLERGEKCVYIADDNTAEAVIKEMKAKGIDVHALVRSGKLAILSKQNAYLKQGHFDPDWMINFLRSAVCEAKAAGFTALRATGEMTWALGGDPGADRLMEYEAKLNYLFHEIDIIAICQYNHNRFSPEVIRGVISTHPLIIYGGMVCRNFYYVPPDEFLGAEQPAKEIDRLLANIRSREEAEEKAGRLAAIVEFSDDAIIGKTLDGIVTSWNKGAEKIFGYTEDEMIGRSISMLVPHGQADEVPMILEKIKRGKHIENCETVRRRKDMQLIDMSLTISPIRDEERKIIGVSTIGRDITGRKLAEKALRESEERFRAFNDNAPAIFFIKDRQGRHLQVNPLFNRLTGLSKADIIGRTVYDIFPKESADVMWANDQKVLVDRQIIQEEEEAIDSSGNQRTFLSVKFPFLNASGEVQGMGGIATDITGHKRIEERLIEAQSIARMGNWEYEPSSGRLWWSDEVYRIFGFGPGDFLPSLTLFLEMVHPDDREELQKQIESGLPYRSEYRICLPDKTEKYLHEEVKVERGDDAKPKRSWGTVQDITERKLAEGVLKASEERYRTLLSSVTDYIYTVEIKNGKTVSTSHGPGCLAVTGYSPEDFEADPYLWYNMISADDRDTIRGLLKDILQDRQLYPAEHRIVCKDGSVKWVRNTAVRRYNELGDLIFYDGLIADITEQKRLELQLQHAQKMESIGTLTGGIAHDFNNILTAIIGFASLVNQRMSDNDPLRSFVTNIEESAVKAANLTRSLLMFSRKQQSNPVFVNISEIFDRMERMLRRIMGEDIELRLAFAKDALYIKADVGQIEQVIMNISANARDAMPLGGSFYISTESIVIDGNFQRQYGYGRPGQYALITMSDTGIGMHELTKEKLFEPFFTTKAVDKGTGLGLSIVYGIIKQHNGYISVDSMPGKGTTFEIYLPMPEKDNDIALYDRKSEMISPAGGSETILVAEDDEMVRSFIVNILSDAGYKIIEAKDGQEAANKFIENKDSIQFVILDAIMPKQSGGQVFMEIIKLRPDIKGIFLSGYATDRLIMEKNDNMLKFLSKPVKPHELLKAIRDELAFND